MRTKQTQKQQHAKPGKSVQQLNGFALIGVSEMQKQMRRIQKGYARVQFAGAKRKGTVCAVVALTGEVNTWR